MVNEDSKPVRDGRTRRRERNMTAVLDAVIELARSGELDPTSEDIAAVAGISHRSIYRYFENRLELFDGAVGRMVETIEDELFFASVGEGSFDERVIEFVEARLAAQTSLFPLVRAVTSHVGELSTSSALAALREALRTQVTLQFATELADLDARSQRLVTAVLDTMFQCEAIDALERSIEHRHEMSEALSHMIRRTLGTAHFASL